MATVRQGAAQQLDADMSGVLVVAAMNIAAARLAVDHIQVELRMGFGQMFEQLFEGVFAAVAQAVVQVNGALRLLCKAPSQHAHHRRDADATGDQHCWHCWIGIDEKLARRCLHLEDVALFNPVMKVAGRSSWR